MSTSVLLTGFTGALGGRFAARLARERARVFCLIRANSDEAARDSFEAARAALRSILPERDDAALSRLTPVAGDLRLGGLGISGEAARQIAGSGVREIWHLAGFADLTEERGQKIYDTHITGTLNLLDFARKAGIQELHAVSGWAAFGNHEPGIVAEIPGIPPASFRNTFERALWEAERRMWQAQIRGEIFTTIYRPALVVGAQMRPRFRRWHPFDRWLDAMKRAPAPPPHAAGHTLNLVDLEHVLETVFRIAAVPRSHGRVYQIVQPEAPTVGALLEAFKRHHGSELHGPWHEDLEEVFASLCPRPAGEVVFDTSNVQNILAFHGGMPAAPAGDFLEAAVRAHAHKPQEQSALAEKPAAAQQGRFVWPREAGDEIDFSFSRPPLERLEPGSGYPLLVRLLSKAYQLREKIAGRRQLRGHTAPGGRRDIVLVPFGMGVTRRGEAEMHCYRHNNALAGEVFAMMNQIAGFDLRAFSAREVPGHTNFAYIHDHCSWAIADDAVHLIRLFRDVQACGGDLVSRLQVMPHSAGTHLTGWLAGILSFRDAALVINQAGHFMSENDRIATLEEMDRWYFRNGGPQDGEEGALLREIRAKVDPDRAMDRDALADKLHGKLELAYSLNADVFRRMSQDLKEHRIGVEHVITMSPHAGVYAGDELAMTRFRNLFAAKNYIGLRRMPLDVKGAPHSQRFRRGAEFTAQLLKYYQRQGRLKVPVIPFTGCYGEWVRTPEDFIAAVAGNADQTYRFDRMIGRALETGGRHFIFVQSGLATLTGNLFEGIIRNKANLMGFGGVHVYRPGAGAWGRHPICEVLDKRPEQAVRGAHKQSLAESLRWYDGQLALQRKKASSGDSE